MKKFYIEYWELDPKTFKKNVVRGVHIEATDQTNAKWKLNKHESLIKSIQLC